ncbi:MAG TPA: calcium-binding protein [Pseudaminobacter sp.]|nr:calcium-binding protein [Pseudaminobacter sp.]
MANIIEGRSSRPERIIGTDLEDWMAGYQGNDRLEGRRGNDEIEGGDGDDHGIGGQGNDRIWGGTGDDYLRGDNGRFQPRLVGEDNDKLFGGPGNDVLYVGDGNDTLTGGEGNDTFLFQFHNPIRGAKGTTTDITTIIDFNAKEDTFAFDAVGLGDDGFGANFVNNAAAQSGSPVSSFYSGPVAGAKGEHVVVITDESFETASAAAREISGEAVGDIIAYYSEDGLSKMAKLAYVTGENQAHDFVNISGVTSFTAMADLGLTASDFTYI